MPIATFDIKDVQKLVDEIKDHQKSGGRFSATMDMIFEGDNFEGGVPLNEDGHSEKECQGTFWPSSKHIKPEAIVPMLRLVGDHGVYLITNQIREDGQAPSKTGLIAYASGCNPNKDDDYDDNKRFFGGDDGSVDIPVAWAELAIKSGAKHFKIKLSSKSVSLVK
ncbi:MAG: hypothetical protein C9356_11795 [Oleiphilus sp.]|nr:MAG: hypothetical protein C9356_11795 [Oleiphilus sp.]